MIAYTLSLMVMCLFLFKPEEAISGKDYFREELDKMGAMNAGEKKS